MLSCKELVARSSDFLDGQLDFRGQLAVRSHLLMCRHCRRFIRQMRLTQATVRHLPEGQGRNSTVWPRISPNCAGRRGAGAGYPRHQAAARDSWAAAFRFRYPAWANRTRPGVGGSLPRDEVEECGWAWRISLRDMRPTEEAAICFAGRASEVEENAWDLANIADRYFSSRAILSSGKGTGNFFDSAVTPPGVLRPLERGRHTGARYQLQELPMKRFPSLLPSSALLCSA